MLWLKGIMKSSKSTSRDKSSFRLSIVDISWLVVGGFPQTWDRQSQKHLNRDCQKENCVQLLSKLGTGLKWCALVGTLDKCPTVTITPLLFIHVKRGNLLKMYMNLPCVLHPGFWLYYIIVIIIMKPTVNADQPYRFWHKGDIHCVGVPRSDLGVLKDDALWILLRRSFPCCCSWCVCLHDTFCSNSL